jgi:hypothetical protein
MGKGFSTLSHLSTKSINNTILSSEKKFGKIL